MNGCILTVISGTIGSFKCSIARTTQVFPIVKVDVELIDPGHFPRLLPNGLERIYDLAQKEGRLQ